MTILEIVATVQRTGVITHDQEAIMERLMWAGPCSSLDRAMLELLLKGLETGRIKVVSELGL